MDLTQEKCPICYEPFNYNKKPYLLLICGHTFCNPCISRIKKECLEDDSKYKSLSDFYREQKKSTNLCDSQTSIFSDNCKKKTDSENDEEKSEENLDESNLGSRLSDSYIEIDEEEEKEKEKNDNINENIDEFINEDKKAIDYERNSENSEFIEDEEEDDEEEENESMSKSEEEDEEKEESDDNSEKSINDINDIIPINDNNKKEQKNKKKPFKFRCPFCMFRLKITDKELIINENLLKINEIYDKSENEITDINNTINLNDEKNYFCEACNNIVTNFSHYEKYGDEHNKYLFELNDNTYKRAFNNLKEFNQSKEKIINESKNFLIQFIEKIIKDPDLIKDCKNNLEKDYKYNSKFMKVLKKSKKKLKKFEDSIQKKKENNNNINAEYNIKLKEEKELYEGIKSFNQLIAGIFFYPEIKMKLIPTDEDLEKILSNIYLSFAIKESFNNSLQNGFFHFLRNKLYKTETKFMPFYSTLTKRNFLFNSELNGSIVLKVPKIYSKCCYEASSDGHTLYFLFSKNSKKSKFFSQNIHTKKKKNLPSLPIINFKKLDTIMYNDKKLFVIGGLDKYDTPITECFYFDFKNNKWEKMPNLKYSRSNKALFTNGKELFTFGGKCPPKDSSYIFEKIDLNTLKNWETFSINNFCSNIYNFGFCMYNQDILFVIGGEDQTTEDYIKKGYVLDLKDKKVIEEFNIDDVHENNVLTPKCYRGIVLSTDKELISIDFFNIWKRLHKLNINLP